MQPIVEDTIDTAAADAGADNLLHALLHVQPGETVLLLEEDPALGFYDTAPATRIAARAQALGGRVRRVQIGLLESLADASPEVHDAIAEADHILYLCRLGGALRFSELSAHASHTACYVLSEAVLAARACTLADDFLAALHQRFEARLNAAARWHLTCPLGTDLRGTQDPRALAAAKPPGFTLNAFPRGSFRPINAHSAHGTVVVAHRLVSTGHRIYPDSALELETPLVATLEAGRMLALEGEDSARAHAHYARVAALFGLEAQADCVNSWHAGLNPGVRSPWAGRDDPERWAVAVLGHPGYAHFHTCGDFVPGEICWSLFNWSLTLDDEPFWQGGRCLFLDSPEVRELARAHGIAPAALVPNPPVF